MKEIPSFFISVIHQMAMDFETVFIFYSKNRTNTNNNFVTNVEPTLTKKMNSAYRMEVDINDPNLQLTSSFVSAIRKLDSILQG